jgi:hypothetical protein
MQTEEEPEQEAYPVFQKREATRIVAITSSLYDEQCDCYRTPCHKNDPFYGTYHQAGYAFLLEKPGTVLTVYGISSPAVQWMITERRARQEGVYSGRHADIFCQVEDGPHDAFLTKRD